MVKDQSEGIYRISNMITIYTLFQAFWIMAGLWLDAKLAWMVIYEFKNPGDGEKYLRGELCIKKKKPETRIIGIIIKNILQRMKNIRRPAENIPEKNVKN